VDPDRLQRGAAEIRSLGFDVRVPEGIGERTGFTAGRVRRRLDELHRLFADESVAGIVCARGGAGAGGLLGHLDPGLLRAHPKALVGYSDITFLHLYLGRLGMTSLHGPMAATQLADGSYDRASFLQGLTGEGPPYATATDDLAPLRTGEGEGVLRGGCLSILAAAAGTPWALAPGKEDTILFLEDVDERPYRIDRMLLQLRASGAFAGVRGIVFGDMPGCAPRMNEEYALEDVLREALDGLAVPVGLGLSSGHTASPAVTLPFGVRARLSCGEEARFEVLESAVA
jgi:muramoyltetrapeptide carboxypeptidase